MEQTEAQLALPRVVQMVVLQEAGQVAFPALEAPQAVQKVVQPVPLQVVVLVKSPE